MYKILIVDDETAIRTLIAKYAAFEGYETDQAENGMQAVEKCRSEKYDLVILDIMMPELDGFSAGRQIKKDSPDLPIILLSARGEEYDRINGFEIGADDYVVKPFSPKELMLRVGAVLKRVNKKETNTASEIFELGGLRADFTARIVTIDGKRVEMSPKEYELFFYMIRNANIALSREKLICEVWGYDFIGDSNIVDVYIRYLRHKIDDHYGIKTIHTIRSVGYLFEYEEE